MFKEDNEVLFVNVHLMNIVDSMMVSNPLAANSRATWVHYNRAGQILFNPECVNAVIEICAERHQWRSFWHSRISVTNDFTICLRRTSPSRIKPLVHSSRITPGVTHST